jgi:hypothetical protein
VAPIALYPDPLLAQALAASTYPLEIMQLQQWLLKNPGLKDKALADAVAQQPWDPAVQSLAAIPELTKRLSDDIQWTNDLGNAFLAQQSDVMDAVQRMRKKAQAKGALASNEQQKVETKVIETKEVIIVEPAKPEVSTCRCTAHRRLRASGISVPPSTIRPPGAALVTFGVGMMVGAAIWGGTCCGCGWGHRPRQRPRQRPQQLQSKHQHQPQRQQQLAAQRPTPGWRSVRRPGHGQQVRWRGAR